MKYTTENLLLKSQNTESGRQLSLTPHQAGWDLIHFEFHRLKINEQWSFATADNELAIILLSGSLKVRANVQTNTDEWILGDRESVFSSGAYVLYLPRNISFTVIASNMTEFAVTWVPTDQDHEPWLIRPDDIQSTLRGGNNVTRRINDLLPPGSPVHRLVLVEVYTPSGNWSSYPPHKHDVVVKDPQGNLLQADLEEIYFYKIDKPEGYAYQRIYTDESSPLHKNGEGFDALICVKNNELVLVPEGYHPVVSAPGYITYYLNVLAGTHQSLAAQDDPRYSWIKETYNG